MGGIKLTSRDVAVLHDCYEHTLLSFSQIHKKHFAGRSISTVSNRLGQLARAGYLRKHRLPVALHLSSPNEVSVVFQTTRSAHKCLKLYFPDASIREDPHRLNLSTLSHDLILNDIMAALRTRFRGTNVVHGRHLPLAPSSSGRCPDAAIVNPSGKLVAAVELELSAKSEKRYRQIALEYMLSREFPKILYVVPGNSLADKIRYQITQQRKVPGLPSPSTGKFYFAALREFLDQPSTASISNGSDELFD